MFYGLPTFNIFSNYRFYLNNDLNLCFSNNLIPTDSVLSLLQLEDNQSFILEVNEAIYFKHFRICRIQFTKYEDYILVEFLDCDKDQEKDKIYVRLDSTHFVTYGLSFEERTYKISHNKLIVFNKMLEIASSGLF